MMENVPSTSAVAARPADQIGVQSLICLVRGNVLGALAAWRAALEGGLRPSLLARVGAVIALAEGRGPRDRAPPSPARSEPPSAGWALAWAGDLDAVRRFATANPQDPSVAALLGVVHLLERRPASALPLLDRALAAGGAREDLSLHRIRALMQLGRCGEAAAALAVLSDSESLGRRLLVALHSARTTSPRDRGFTRRCKGLAASEAHLNGLFSTLLPAVVGRAALEKAYKSPGALAALIEGVLDRMAGNLGTSPTVAEVSATGERRFVPFAVPPTSRDVAVAALHSLPCVGVEGVEAAFDAAGERHHLSSHVRCYRGEFYLWLGRYSDAWREFESTSLVEPVRWADIGKLAVLVLTGRHAEARAIAVETERRFPPILGGTLPVYRGLLHRRAGALEAAIQDLNLRADRETKPGVEPASSQGVSRCGRWVRHAEATEHAGVLLEEVALLLVDVAEAERGRLAKRAHLAPRRHPPGEGARRHERQPIVIARYMDRSGGRAAGPRAAAAAPRAGAKSPRGARDLGLRRRAILSGRPSMEQLSRDTRSHEQHRVLSIRGKSFCNSACVFCVEKTPEYHPVAPKVDETRRLILAGAGKFNMLFFMNGEPSLHPKLLDYVTLAKSHGYRYFGMSSHFRAFADPHFALKILEAGFEFLRRGHLAARRHVQGAGGSEPHRRQRALPQGGPARASATSTRSPGAPGGVSRSHTRW